MIDRSLIARLAGEAGLPVSSVCPNEVLAPGWEGEPMTDEIHRFVASVAEQCAKVCDSEAMLAPTGHMQQGAQLCATAIRAKFGEPT